MRPRDRILANLESIYRETYDRAKAEGAAARMADLENSYMRDQLMLALQITSYELNQVQRRLVRTETQEDGT